MQEENNARKIEAPVEKSQRKNGNIPDICLRLRSGFLLSSNLS
jgi:hypothetical protein